MNRQACAEKAKEWSAKASGRIRELWRELWSGVELSDVLAGLGVGAFFFSLAFGVVMLLAGFGIPTVLDWTDRQSKRWEVEQIKLEIDKRVYEKELVKLKAEEEKQEKLWLRPLETSFPPKPVIEDIPVIIQVQGE